jgi:hypothetical protein
MEFVDIRDPPVYLVPHLVAYSTVKPGGRFHIHRA